MEFLSTFDALMKLRRGRAFSAKDVGELTSLLEQPLDIPALFVRAPHWLVESLNSATDRSKQQLVFLEADDRSNPLLVIVMQTGSAQLRLVLHLNDAQVQHVLHHALACGLLTTLVCTEHAPLFTGVTTAVEGEAQVKLAGLLDSVKGVTGDLSRALRLAAEVTKPGDLPSVFNDTAVMDVVTALVAGDVDELSDDAVAGLTPGMQPTGNRAH
ncbi:hypothetical protein CDN99_04165 [Roseateles aquatilis]|uniref:Uncharacterized protein n=1 Tax=Roseateles aquatilis TaxID=431061 RepID=A0A246JM85_9BURK|nr:hypothetical protein [Roseateles aquatilis]OWQ93660.1 hypothetical protein CDN99_04165 [Roseateles aquatilis]